MKNNNRNFKEPVRLREKPLKDGSKSLYLDIYVKGERTREYLKLYLIPEIDQGAKMQNKETLKAANAIKSQRIIEFTQEKAGIPKSSSRSRMLLIDYMKTYSRRKLENGTSDAFHKQIEKAIKHLIKYRGAGITMQEVDKDYCLGFIDYLNHARRKDGKIMAKVTTAGYLRCLNCALNQAVRDEIISENPITKIDSDQRIKIPESTREYLTLEEVKTLINAPCRNVIVKQAFLFSCFTGLRIGDVQKLKWSDISKEEGRYKVKIVMSKTKKPSINLLVRKQ